MSWDIANNWDICMYSAWEIRKGGCAKVSAVARFLARICLSLTRRTWQCDASLAIIHKMVELYRPPSVFQQNNCEWELLPVDVSKKARRQRWNHSGVEGWSFFMPTLYRGVILLSFPLPLRSLTFRLHRNYLRIDDFSSSSNYPYRNDISSNTFIPLVKYEMSKSLYPLGIVICKERIMRNCCHFYNI